MARWTTWTSVSEVILVLRDLHQSPCALGIRNGKTKFHNFPSGSVIPKFSGCSWPQQDPHTYIIEAAILWHHSRLLTPTPFLSMLHRHQCALLTKGHQVMTVLRRDFQSGVDLFKIVPLQHITHGTSPLAMGVVRVIGIPVILASVINWECDQYDWARGSSCINIYVIWLFHVMRRSVVHLTILYKIFGTKPRMPIFRHMNWTEKGRWVFGVWAEHTIRDNINETITNCSRKNVNVHSMKTVA